MYQMIIGQLNSRRGDKVNRMTIVTAKTARSSTLEKSIISSMDCGTTEVARQNRDTFAKNEVRRMHHPSSSP